MQDIMYYVNVYTNIPDAIEFQEQKSNEDIDRIVKIKKDYMEFYND